MAQVNNPQFPLVLRQNRNTYTSAYGKYYVERAPVKTISTRGLCDHMASHQSIYSRDVIEGVITKMRACLVELLSEGNPVKLDGIGTLDPQVETNKNGISQQDIVDGKYNPQQHVAGVHIRLTPEGAESDKITSRVFKEKCSFTTQGVLEPVDLTPEETVPSKKKWGYKTVPLDVWIAEVTNASNSGTSGSGSGSSSGNGGNTGGSGGGDDEEIPGQGGNG
jgi:uncharacterized membrane protein YgcG